MDKEELKLQLMKWHNKMSEKFGFNMEDSSEFSELMEQLDEPKKVVIPQFVAKLIEGASVIYGNEPLRIAHGIVAKGTSNDNGGSWLSDVNNQKLLLNAIANGYEVEKEKKYLVKIKGIGLEEEWLNCEVVGDIRHFELNSSTESKIYKTNFTKQWLKDNWPEYEAYNNAGLLEFEEVEDEQASTEKGTTR